MAKKLLCVLLVLAMVLSIGTVAFADSSSLVDSLAGSGDVILEELLKDYCICTGVCAPAEGVHTGTDKIMKINFQTMNGLYEFVEIGEEESGEFIIFKTVTDGDTKTISMIGHNGAKIVEFTAVKNKDGVYEWKQDNGDTYTFDRAELEPQGDEKRYSVIKEGSGSAEAYKFLKWNLNSLGLYTEVQDTNPSFVKKLVNKLLKRDYTKYYLTRESADVFATSKLPPVLYIRVVDGGHTMAYVNSYDGRHHVTVCTKCGNVCPHCIFHNPVFVTDEVDENGERVKMCACGYCTNDGVQSVEMESFNIDVLSGNHTVAAVKVTTKGDFLEDDAIEYSFDNEHWISATKPTTMFDETGVTLNGTSYPTFENTYYFTVSSDDPFHELYFRIKDGCFVDDGDGYVKYYWVWNDSNENNVVDDSESDCVHMTRLGSFTVDKDNQYYFLKDDAEWDSFVASPFNYDGAFSILTKVVDEEEVLKYGVIQYNGKYIVDGDDAMAHAFDYDGEDVEIATKADKYKASFKTIDETYYVAIQEMLADYDWITYNPLNKCIDGKVILLPVSDLTDVKWKDYYDETVEADDRAFVLEEDEYSSDVFYVYVNDGPVYFDVESFAADDWICADAVMVPGPAGNGHIYSCYAPCFTIECYAESGGEKNTYITFYYAYEEGQTWADFVGDGKELNDNFKLTINANKVYVSYNIYGTENSDVELYYFDCSNRSLNEFDSNDTIKYWSRGCYYATNHESD